MTEFDGLGSTFTRSTFETLNGGAVLGRLRSQARTMTWKGYLFGINCCAAEYGLRWLTARLAGSGGCDGCDGSELDILLCCPDVLECADCELGLKQTPEKDFGIGPASEAFRTFYKAGLIDGPKVVSRREIGCRAGCGGVDPTCGNCEGCLIEVEFSIVAGNPYMHKDPVAVCSKKFPDCDADISGCVALDLWEKVSTASYPATEADAIKCQDLLDCSTIDHLFKCITDPTCATATLPTIPPFEDSCGGCEGFFTTDVCCEISNDIYGQFFEGVPSIDIYSGKTKEMRNVVVSFYENPRELTCNDPAVFASDCYKCSSLNIRYIPPNTIISIDGLTRRVTATCGGNTPIPAESLTVSPFKWPVLKCISYIVRVEADCAFKPGLDATVTVTVTPREM